LRVRRADRSADPCLSGRSRGDLGGLRLDADCVRSLAATRLKAACSVPAAGFRLRWTLGVVRSTPVGHRQRPDSDGMANRMSTFTFTASDDTLTLRQVGGADVVIFTLVKWCRGFGRVGLRTSVEATCSSFVTPRRSAKPARQTGRFPSKTARRSWHGGCSQTNRRRELPSRGRRWS
jgi:hypothetical protein